MRLLYACRKKGFWALGDQISGSNDSGSSARKKRQSVACYTVLIYSQKEPVFLVSPKKAN